MTPHLHLSIPNGPVRQRHPLKIFLQKEEIQNRFDRLIKRVSEISSEEIRRIQGQVMPVLIEGVSEQNPELLTGRLSNNILVHFKGDASLIGEIRNVSLDACKGFYYMGKLV